MNVYLGGIYPLSDARAYRRSRPMWALTVLLMWPIAANAQTDVLVIDCTGGIGSICLASFPHDSLPGATGIDFSFSGTATPSYPATEVHTVDILFGWGPTETGPWTESPPFVSTVPGGVTVPVTAGVYPGPEDAPFVSISFNVGGPMTIAGDFTHTSVVPEPSALVLLGVGLLALPIGQRRRQSRVA